MPLTRHLYELDEVVSALQLCLHNDDPTALFWLWELIVSGEERSADVLLTDAWFQWSGGIDAEHLHETSWAKRYARIKPASDNAISVIAQCQKPTITRKPAQRDRQKLAEQFASAVDKPDALDFWLDLDDACRRKNTVAAAWFLAAAQPNFTSTEIWTALSLISPNPLFQIINDKAIPENQLLAQMNAIFLVCNPRPTPTIDTQSAEHRWNSWVVGRRTTRIYAIPEQALDSRTNRGAMPSKYTNIEDLRDPIGLLSEGCKFWQEAVQAAGITMKADIVCFPSDEAKERFYEQYFPDDIPDEWSDADQKKSHGCGALEKAISPPIHI